MALTKSEIRKIVEEEEIRIREESARERLEANQEEVEEIRHLVRAGRWENDPRSKRGSEEVRKDVVKKGVTSGSRVIGLVLGSCALGLGLILVSVAAVSLIVLFSEEPNQKKFIDLASKRGFAAWSFAVQFTSLQILVGGSMLMFGQWIFRVSRFRIYVLKKRKKNWWG